MSSEGSDEALGAQQQQQQPPTEPAINEPAPADGPSVDARPPSPPLEGDHPPVPTTPGQPETEGQPIEADISQTPLVDPSQVASPSSPSLAPSSPLPSVTPSPASSPASRPPLGPPPRSRARLSPGPSGLSSPAATSRRVSAAPTGEVGVAAVAKALDYGDKSSTESDAATPDAEPRQLASEPIDPAEEWSTPALPSFREASQGVSDPPSTSTLSGLDASASTSALSSSADWVAPSVESAGPPELPPRSSSLGPPVHSSPGHSSWSSPSFQSPNLSSSSSSSFLKPPTSPQIPDHEATGPMPKRRSSSGVYTPSSFPGPLARKGSAPAAVLRPPPLLTTGGAAMYRKASEGAGLGLGLPSGGTTSAAHAPLAATALPSSGGWGLWSSARSYFSTPLASTPVATEVVSPLATTKSEPPPSLASALQPAETDTMLPNGSLSPSNVYTPNSFYEQQQQHLRSLGLGSALLIGPKGVGSRSPSLSDPSSPAATAPRAQSTARKPAPVLDDGAAAEEAFSALLALPAGGATRKPVPAYAHYPEEDEAESTVDSGVDATAPGSSPPSSQGPTTPAWEQPKILSLPNDEPTQAPAKPVDGEAGFSGFKGLGKDMAVLEVALPLEQQEAQERASMPRAW